MSRSRKKTSVTTYVGYTQKRSKRLCNRMFRRLEHQRIGTDYPVPQHVREALDVWCMQGDGKHRWTPDMVQYEKIMRKK